MVPALPTPSSGHACPDHILCTSSSVDIIYRSFAPCVTATELSMCSGGAATACAKLGVCMFELDLASPEAHGDQQQRGHSAHLQ